MEIINLLNVIVEMFLFLIAGAVMKRVGALNDQAKGVLSNLVLDFVMPCNIIHSFLIEFNMDILRSFAEILVLAIVIQIYSYILSRVFYRRETPARRKVFRYITMVSNAGFLGNPIVEGIYGAQGLMYASIYLIPQRIVMWSAGVSCFTEAGSKKDLVKKVVTHPCIVAVYIGLILMLTQVQLPGFLEVSIRAAGGCTTTLTMVLIGTIFADVKLSEVVDAAVVRFTLIRLVLIPGIIFVICRLLGVSALLTQVSVLLAGMPAGTTSPILAEKYHGDSIFASKCVIFSTLMSLVSVTLWCMIL
ncbi:MAG: AEC family transporter [Clostridiales bacterium]|nr:AEC family transporter [Clostridiales bacterium]